MDRSRTRMVDAKAVLTDTHMILSCTWSSEPTTPSLLYTQHPVATDLNEVYNIVYYKENAYIS